MVTRPQIASPTPLFVVPKPIICGKTPIAAGKKKRRKKIFLRFFTPNSHSPPPPPARSRRNPSRGECPAVSAESASFRQPPPNSSCSTRFPHADLVGARPGFAACSLPIGESASGLARSSILSAALLNLAVWSGPPELACSRGDSLLC